MSYYKMKKAAAVILSAALAVSVAACGRSSKKETVSDDTEKKAAEVTTEAVDETTPDYVADGVKIPENFDHMIYPITALATQAYKKNLPYYASSSDSSDSFWFSMAVLSSMMYDSSDVSDLDLRHSGNYIYPDEDTTKMFAAALYADFGKGDLEYPEIGSTEFATFDEDNDLYGFIYGSINGIKVMITDCEETSSGYEIEVEISDSNSSEDAETYTARLVDTTYDGRENVFEYSVDAFGEKDSLLDDDSSESDTRDSSETTAYDFSGSGDEDDSSSTEEDSTNQSSSYSGRSSDVITRSEAESKAADAYGDENGYSYQGKVEIGSKNYYDFTISSSDYDFTDVLVSEDGEDVIAGSKNSDGSWSFSE